MSIMITENVNGIYSSGEEGRKPSLSLNGTDTRVRQRKYKLSSSSTPSPSEEYKGFSNGFYQRNLTSASSFQNSETDSKKQNSPGLDNAGFNSDDVFTITDRKVSPKSKSLKNGDRTRIESARAESAPKPPQTAVQKRCLVILGILTVLGLLAGIAVILYVNVFKEESTSTTTISSTTTTTAPVTFGGSLKLNNAWQDDLSNSSSQLYQETANNFTGEIDIIMQAGNTSEFYIGTTVRQFVQGSVQVYFDMSFGPRYTSVFLTEENLSQQVEDEIEFSIFSRETTLPIIPQTVNITGRIPDTSTPLPATSTTTTETTRISDLTTTTTEKTTSTASKLTTGETTTPKSDTTSSAVVTTTIPSTTEGEVMTTKSDTTTETTTTIAMTTTESTTVGTTEKTTEKATSVETTTKVDTPTTTTVTTTIPSTSTTRSSTDVTTAEQTTTESTTTSMATTTKQVPSTTQTTTPPSTSTTTTAEVTTSTKATTTTSEILTTKITSVVTTSLQTTTKAPDVCMESTVTECRDLGHTKIMFPNVFRHTSESEALAYFNLYKPESCSQNATYFMCALLFPTCDGGTLKFPCQDFCSGVAADCSGGFTLGSDNVCNAMPTTDCVGPLGPLPTTLAPTTTKAPTTTPDPCLQSTVAECRNLGHTDIIFPNVFGHASESDALVYFITYKAQSCSQNATYFMCALLFPTCDGGALKFPCRDFCYSVAADCVDGFTLGSDAVCSSMPTTDCVGPLGPLPSTEAPTTTKAPTTTTADLCLDSTVTECRQLGHTDIIFPNIFGHTAESQALIYFDQYKPQSCSLNATLFLCAMLFPTCENGYLKNPCQDFCNDVALDCGQDFTFGSYCSVLPNTDCVGPLNGSFVLTTTTTTMAPTTTPDICFEATVPECLNYNLTEIIFPNLFVHNSESEALQFFNAYKTQSCSDKAMYLTCTFFFPHCANGSLLLPCKQLCEEVVAECGTSFTLGGYCSLMPETGCVESPTLTPIVTTTPEPVQCLNSTVQECRNLGHTQVAFPNLFAHESESQARSVFDQYLPSSCSANATYFLCNLLFPSCQNSVKKNPCKSFCLGVQQECGSDFTPAQSAYCDSLDNNNCVGPLPPAAVTTTPAPPENCSLTGQHTCPSGKCIMMEWLCDGQPDCPDGSDEANCSKCTGDQFTCLDGSCVSKAERCNQMPACPDQSDERDCLSLNKDRSILQLMYEGYPLPLCYENWDESYGPLVCENLGLGNYTNSSKVEHISRQFLFMDSTSSVNSYLGPLTARSQCQDDSGVSVQCKPRGCGQRLVGRSLVQYIIEGYDAIPGNWPWQAAIQLESGSFRKHVCGGSLIAPNFVLTATHCVTKYIVDLSLIKVLLGANNRDVAESTQKKYGVKKIINFNATYREFGPGDITLFELSETVQYTEYIQPICLPDETDEFYETSLCYATGWGYTSPGQSQEFAAVLQELKTKIWNMDKCNASTAWNGTIAHGYMCAGYESGIRSVCTGDSGGPLACKTNEGIWKLVGISSYVSSNCNWTSKPNVFTDVKQYLDWINYEKECKFQCDNGKCLYQTSLLCNRKDDCGDNSDEVRPCHVSVNCTFDDSFLCGYGVENFSWKSGTEDSQADTTLPWGDHTIGHYPGHYLAGKTLTSFSGVLTTPKFQSNSQMCVTFYYNLRGYLSERVWINAYQYSSSGQTTSRAVWNTNLGQAHDGWTLGHFDLSAGEYHLTFTVADTMKVAFDDIQVNDGMCSQSVCTGQEYKCSKINASSTVCLPPSAVCDIKQDCLEDETSCQGVERRYNCSFESAMDCGISQKTGDSGEWLLVNQTFLKIIFYNEAFYDHTTDAPDGWMLFLLTNLQRDVGKSIGMSQLFFPDNQQFCLSFYYRSDTEMTFKVYAESNNTIYSLWNFTDRIAEQWTKAQMQLPIVQQATIHYEVVRLFPSVVAKYRPYVALDDIMVQPGSCPTYVCPENRTKCVSEDYCYPPEDRCDRKVQCYDESDEAQCVCSANEFSCANGRCIDSSLKCDKKPDCLDQSDEGSVCDSLVSVSCNFDQPYICGYSINNGDFYWIRNSGVTSSYFTGPPNDHTWGTSKGYYMYAEGNYGAVGDYATLTSPEFTTTAGQSLSFYYHILEEEQWTTTGGLAVIANYNTSENFELWWRNTSTGNTWTLGCIDLPVNRTMVIDFVTRRKGDSRNGIYDADVAIDDVAYQSIPCSSIQPMQPTTPVPQSTTSGCRTDEFRCGNGLCIPISNRCDNIPECIDESDERDCS